MDARARRVVGGVLAGRGGGDRALAVPSLRCRLAVASGGGDAGDFGAGRRRRQRGGAAYARAPIEAHRSDEPGARGLGHRASDPDAVGRHGLRQRRLLPLLSGLHRLAAGGAGHPQRIPRQRRHRFRPAQGRGATHGRAASLVAMRQPGRRNFLVQSLGLALGRPRRVHPVELRGRDLAPRDGADAARRAHEARRLPRQRAGRLLFRRRRPAASSSSTRRWPTGSAPRRSELVESGARLTDFLATPAPADQPAACALRGRRRGARRGDPEGPPGAASSTPLITQSVVRDGDRLRTRSVVRDLTPRARMGRGAAAVAPALPRFFANAPVGIALLDRDGRIEEANRALCGSSAARRRT